MFFPSKHGGVTFSAAGRTYRATDAVAVGRSENAYVGVRVNAYPFRQVGWKRGKPIVNARAHDVSPHGGSFGRIVAAAERIPFSVPLLLARIGIAAVFFRSGLVKLDSWTTTLLLFHEEYRVPLLPAETAAWLATGFELVCPVLLVLGLATRLATLPLLAMTIVIQFFVYPSSWIDHTIWAALLLMLLARGAGAISIDALLARFIVRD